MYNEEMRLKILLFSICFLIADIVYATPQETDQLLFNGDKYSLLQFPLEGYFVKNPHKRPELPTWTSRWRGYSALFEIKQNKLFVINMNNSFNSKVYIDWWSGMLIIPDGKLLESDEPVSYYVRLKYYEYYKFIEIKNGNVINVYMLNNVQYRKYDAIISDLFEKTEVFKKIYGEWETKEYSEIYSELNDGVLPNEIVKYVTNNYKITTKFIDYLPVIFYNDNTFASFIQEEIENNPEIKKDIYDINLDGKLIGSISVMCVIVIIIIMCLILFTKKRVKYKKHNVA